MIKMSHLGSGTLLNMYCQFPALGGVPSSEHYIVLILDQNTILLDDEIWHFSNTGGSENTRAYFNESQYSRIELPVQAPVLWDEFCHRHEIKLKKRRGNYVEILWLMRNEVA